MMQLKGMEIYEWLARKDTQSSGCVYIRVLIHVFFSARRIKTLCVPRPVLHNISLEIRAGQRVVLMGRAGW